jgi:hypothetical protein
MVTHSLRSMQASVLHADNDQSNDMARIGFISFIFFTWLHDRRI